MSWGCDGAHSTVRGLLGIDFVGNQYETHIMLADVQLTHPPEQAMFASSTRDGAVIVVPFGEGWYRAIAWDRSREHTPLATPLPIEEMRDAFARIVGKRAAIFAEQGLMFRILDRRLFEHGDGLRALIGAAEHLRIGDRDLRVAGVLLVLIAKTLDVAAVVVSGSQRALDRAGDVGLWPGRTGA